MGYWRGHLGYYDEQPIESSISLFNKVEKTFHYIIGINKLIKIIEAMNLCSNCIINNT